MISGKVWPAFQKTFFRGTASKNNSYNIDIHFEMHWTNLRPWQTRTHRCGHIVAVTNVSPFARVRNICCGHKFCVRDTLAKNVSDCSETFCVRSKCFPVCTAWKHNIHFVSRAFARPRNMSNNVSATMCPRLPGPQGDLWTFLSLESLFHLSRRSLGTRKRLRRKKIVFIVFQVPEQP